jgi:rfaE bifunctional protein nucleotidyltransferase chain/domain
MFSADSALALVRSLRAQRTAIVLTNGVFDLLHPGHVRYLQHARRLGGALIVAVNSDRSVREHKGPGRPIIPDTERAEILAALACVDGVVIFDEATPYAIISALQPDVLVKGSDWAADAIVGRDVVKASGGIVVRATMHLGYSTSAIIRKIRREP